MKTSDYWKLRETFYNCRDFEIKNLWQKSVLLTAFFVLCFTVYANILPLLFENNSDIIKGLLFSEVCSGISLVGLSFSFVWIMMAKGSKAWYELYETAICNIERDKSLKIPEEYAMGEIYSNRPIDGNLFTNVAGAYSPSKLNIVVGRIFLII